MINLTNNKSYSLHHIILKTTPNNPSKAEPYNQITIPVNGAALPTDSFWMYQPPKKLERHLDQYSNHFQVSLLFRSFVNIQVHVSAPVLLLNLNSLYKGNHTTRKVYNRKKTFFLYHFDAIGIFEKRQKKWAFQSHVFLYYTLPSVFLWE